jgi:hypothetical protein
LLVALAITAILLAAVATAFNAAAINYRQNEDIFKAINSARQALFRITTQLRTAVAVDPNAPNNECTMITAAGQDITYRYVDDTGALYLITNDDLSDGDYLLCESVTAMAFTKDTVTEEGQTKVKSVQISMAVASDQVERKLSAAAVVRRNLD